MIIDSHLHYLLKDKFLEELLRGEQKFISAILAMPEKEGRLMQRGCPSNRAP